MLVIQNDLGNKFSPTVIVAAITSNMNKTDLPTHIVVECEGILKKSIVLLEQIRTIDKSRLRKKVGKLPGEQMKKVDKALKISVGF